MDKSRSTSRWMRWFSNPWLGLLGTIFSIAGVVLSIYLYTLSRKEPDLSYYVHPSKSVILKSGQTSGLRVLYKENEISSDVTGAQISIWNQGSQPIRKENVLGDLRIVTSPPVRILEATVRKPSRSVIQFALDDSHLSEGFVPISWKILEKNDGAVIQLIYAASSDVQIALEGATEGQPNGPTRFVRERSWRWVPWFFNIFLYGATAVFLIKRIRRNRQFIVFKVLVLCVLLSVWVFSVWFVMSELRGSNVLSVPYGL